MRDRDGRTRWFCRLYKGKRAPAFADQVTRLWKQMRVRDMDMEDGNANTSGCSILRTKSDQMVELMGAALAAMRSPGNEVEESGSGSSHSRKTRCNAGKNTQIRKSTSAQMMKFDSEDLNSASFGLSFSFTGFTAAPDEIADSKAFTDDDHDAAEEDIEASMTKKKLHRTEPTLPIYLKFTDVTYRVVLRGMRTTMDKDILNGITGSVDPGEVLALMGPSGSGKTTLLSLLGGRLRESSHGGSITYNDQPYSKPLKSRIGFVTQDDVLFPHLTVKETLMYAARLRLPSTLTNDEKYQRATDVIYELGLERCQDTMIGGSFVRGASGGERKRVCIGNEIIINPSILLLDEPTTGLDSTTALRTIETLRCIAEVGKTVITTIHQPSSRLFIKFDKLILLGKGSLLYCGKASEATSYFSSIGCSPLIAMNPAEFMLDLANGNLTDISVPSELKDRLQIENSDEDTKPRKPSPAVVHEYLVEACETRLANSEKKKSMDRVPIDEETKSNVCSTRREWGASWWEQFFILLRRGLKERRHEYLSWLRITQVLATATILGLLWWQSGSNDPDHLQDQTGLLFFIAVFWGFFPVFTAIFTFPQERAMLHKERAADMYRLSAYFMARTTCDLPLDLLLPLLFLLVVYFMAGLRMTADAFFLTLLTVFLCIIAAQGLGLAIGATLMDLKRATTLASVTVMTFMLAGGYFVKNVPVFISWLRYLSFNYHTYKLLIKVQYEHISHRINGVGIDNGYNEVGVLGAMVVGYRVLAYLSLRRMR